MYTPKEPSQKCTSIFISVLFVTAKKQQLLKYSTEQWGNNCTMTLYVRNRLDLYVLDKFPKQC